METRNLAKDKKVFTETLKSARIGTLDAQYEVGLMYANGIGVQKDLVQAIHWIQQSAQRGLSAAQYLLATRYASGVGVVRDDYQALKWYFRAAEQRHPKALFRLGRLFSTRQIDIEMHSYRKAAELGLPEAQLGLGRILLQGNAQAEPDPDAARAWFHQAAVQGLPSAQAALADIYALGLGVTPDLDEALVWYRQAVAGSSLAAHVALHRLDMDGVGRSVDSKRSRRRGSVAERRRSQDHWVAVASIGDAEAKYHLGLMYERGWGVTQNAEKAIAWYQVAAELGEERANMALAKLLETLDVQAAIGAYRRAAAAGNSSASFALGRLLSSGSGSVKDSLDGFLSYAQSAHLGNAAGLVTLGSLLAGMTDHFALEAFARAANMGVAEAQFRLGQYLFEGKGVEKDASQAAAWFEKAAVQGHVQAQSSLGVMYLRGHGVAKEAKSALHWFQQAAEQGDAKAQWNLGSMYASGGPDGKKDQKLAFVWCQRAADQDFAPAQATLGGLFAAMGKQKEAIFWLSKAADLDDPEAQHNLATLYLKDKSESFEEGSVLDLFRKAASAGVVASQAKLALLYATGAGGAPMDPIEAHKWFLIAKNAGDSASKANLEKSGNLLNKAQMLEAQSRARDWGMGRKA